MGRGTGSYILAQARMGSRHAPQMRKAPGAGPGYWCQPSPRRPTRWVGIHALVRGQRVARTEGSEVGVGAEAGAGAMGDENGGAGTTRDGPGGGGGAMSAGELLWERRWDPSPALGLPGDPRVNQGGLPGEGAI